MCMTCGFAGWMGVQDLWVCWAGECSRFVGLLNGCVQDLWVCIE